MFPSTHAIKSTARYSLAKAWPGAIAIVFVLFGVMVLPSLIFQLLDAITASLFSRYEAMFALIDSIYTFFILGPLMFGVFRWFWGITAQVEMPTVVIFSAFSSGREYGKALKVAWAFIWRLELIGLPNRIFAVLNEYFPTSVEDLDLGVIISLISDVVWLITTIFSIILIIRLLPLPFSAINHPYERIRENVRESFAISKSNTTPYFNLLASMIGWALLSIFIIPIIYTLPWFLACYAVLIRFSINHCIHK